MLKEMVELSKLRVWATIVNTQNSVQRAFILFIWLQLVFHFNVTWIQFVQC